MGRTEDASDNHCVEREVSKSQNSEVDRETWSSHVMGHGTWVPGTGASDSPTTTKAASDFQTHLYNFACLNFSRCPFLLLPLISQPKTTMLSPIHPSYRERAPSPSSRITRSPTASTSSHVFPKQASKYVNPPHLPRVDALNQYLFNRL